jgi:hypothetical protein
LEEIEAVVPGESLLRPLIVGPTPAEPFLGRPSPPPVKRPAGASPDAPGGLLLVADAGQFWAEIKTAVGRD